MTSAASGPTAVAHVAIALQAFREARLLRRGRLLLGALNRLYFAAFHLSAALLASSGVEAKSHRGLHSLLGLHFVKPGRLDVGFQQTLARLETWRDKADYDLGFVADATLFDRELRATLQLQSEIFRQLRRAGIKLPRQHRG